MFQNYLKIAFRSLWKRKSFAAINITGLAVGIAASLLLFVVIHSETSYDGWQSKGRRIYRMVTTYKNASNGEVSRYESAAPLPMAEALRHEFPQMEQVARIWNIGGAQIHVPGAKGVLDEKIYLQEKGYFCEPSLFRMFDFQWVEGNAAGLDAPNTVVIAKSLADAWFGNAQAAIGKKVEMWSFRVPLQILGVYKDLPYNTDMEMSMGASMRTFDGLNKLSGDPSKFMNDPSQWKGTLWPSECFVLLHNPGEKALVESRLPGFVSKYYPEEAVKGEHRTALSLEPLLDMHLDEHWYTFKSDALTHRELWTLALIGIFLLLVASVNFVNLSTALSVTRAREIGLRKVLGSSRMGLLQQFLQETALICVIAVVLGCVLARLAMPALAALMSKPLELDLFGQPAIGLFLLVTAILVTFISGFYPGLVLSRFNPVMAIKSKINTSRVGGISLRRGLVVFQFVIAQLLIIGTLVVVKQMKFFRSQPLGFEKNAIVSIELPSDSADQAKYPYMKAAMEKLAGVEAVSYSLDQPAAWGFPNTDFFFENDPVKKDFTLQLQFADTGYLNTFKIGLAAGRLPVASDTIRELLVNETAVKRLGLRSPAEMLGKRIRLTHDNVAGGYPVVGVMKDYHSRSLHTAIDPIAIITNSKAYNFINVRMRPEMLSQTVGRVQTLFHHTFPTYLYTARFMDERLDSFYHTELMISALFKIFAGLAIFISCLGLYGLVSFMAVQKTKEVGIRKVLGASVASIVYMFSREFTVLIGLAFLIAGPLGYYFMDRWLSGFYYHIAIGWWVMVLAVVGSVLVAWITVGYRAMRAAVANPVDSLRAE